MPTTRTRPTPSTARSVTRQAKPVRNLSATQFMDSSGISVLLKGRREADKTRVAYRITGATDMDRHIFSLTGVLEFLSDDSAVDSLE